MALPLILQDMKKCFGFHEYGPKGLPNFGYLPGIFLAKLLYSGRPRPNSCQNICQVPEKKEKRIVVRAEVRDITSDFACPVELEIRLLQFDCSSYSKEQMKPHLCHLYE